MVSHPNRLPDEKPMPLASFPFVLVHFVPLLAIFTGAEWADWRLLLITYWTRMFFITAGYHRYFAHKSYKTNRVVQFLLAFGGTMAAQKGPLWWAGHHRLHHRYTDTVRDVHSPIKGVIYSHVGWIVSERSKPTPFEAIADFAKYPELRFINKYDWIGPWTLGVACFLVGGWSGLLIGFLLSTVLVWHCTFLVNSMAHLWGTRRFATADSSRNNVLIAFLTMGEGWHNNHHHLQSSCRQGFRWYEIDASFYILKVLSWLGIVKDIKKPNAKALATARIKDGAFDIGMYEFHMDKAMTRVAAATASATGRADLDEARLEFTMRADDALASARELGRQTRRKIDDGTAVDAEAAALASVGDFED